MKRLIHRKGIAGFAQDPTRVLATFLTSNARAAAANYHFGEMLRAAATIPKEKGDVKDEAADLIGYIQTPREEAAKLRSLLFINFLGGSVASALVNMTQSFTTTFPYLHQFGGNTAGAMGEAMRIAARRMFNRDVAIADVALKEALERATDEGLVSPHEVHMLYGESMRTGMFQNNRFTRNLVKVWGSLFSLAEHFNRDAAFIAAYRIAERRGLGGEEAYQFAKRAVYETQFIYSKANRPDWARGAVGATLFTFKQFSVSYLEFLKRLPAKERALALAILFLGAGLQGLPGADDLDDLVDTIAESLGFAVNSKQARRDFIAKVLGKEAAGFVSYGVSYGLPLDFAGRLSVGNLIPGTALFKRSEPDKSRDVLEVFGAAGSFGRQGMQAFDKAQAGRPLEAVRELMPKALRDACKAYEMATTGLYLDTKGRKVTEVGPVDAFVKGLGFQPTVVAENSRARRAVQQGINLGRAVEAGIADLWAQGIHERNPAKVAQARADLAAWNAQNPAAPIALKLSQVQRRVREMRLSADERLTKAAPRELRGKVSATLSE
jgi:hypothetical protein